MIYSFIILTSSLLLFPVRSADKSFYIKNAGAIEECSTGANIYLNKFDSTKMRCLDKTWRHVSFTNEYLCGTNGFKRNWTGTTNANQNAEWPQKIYILTENGIKNDYTPFYSSKYPQNQIIAESLSTFDPNNNQLVSYIWTEIRGPQCRSKYTIIKDICTAKKGQTVGAKLNEFVCYYGKQDFKLLNKDQRENLNKLIDAHTKSNSNTGQKNPSTGNSTINSQTDPDLSPLNADKITFWQKNQRNILIGGGIGGFIVLVAIILIIICRQRSPNKDTETRMSVESN